MSAWSLGQLKEMFLVPDRYLGGIFSGRLAQSQIQSVFSWLSAVMSPSWQQESSTMSNLHAETSTTSTHIVCCLFVYIVYSAAMKPSFWLDTCLALESENYLYLFCLCYEAQSKTAGFCVGAVGTPRTANRANSGLHLDMIINQVIQKGIQHNQVHATHGKEALVALLAARSSSDNLPPW